ncbi:Hsp70 family protein [Polymorphospora rubra]|uniref:Hsp70 family protein n=1 Tax=Polymorphospora rubra TaxID=338584 RepID=UPI0033E914F2
MPQRPTAHKVVRLGAVSRHHLGIDYGTSHTVAVVRWPDGRCRPLLFDGSPLLPSALFLGSDGDLVAGRDAAHSARLDPARFAPYPKRHVDEGVLLLGDRSVPLVEAVAATLARVAVEAVRACGLPPARVTMTYPAGWGAVRRDVLVGAATRAGLPAPTLVPEPVAAAGYFTAVLGHAVRPGHLLVVYDLGAGTFDVGVVRRTGTGFEVCDVDGMADFGGLDLDALVVARVGAAIEDIDPAAWQRLTAPSGPADQRHFRTLWDDARNVKEMLSRQSSAGLHVPLVEREVPVGREEFEASSRPYLERAAVLTRQVMARSGATAGNLAGVFLVGGASRVPLVATTLHHVTGVAPTVLEQPELVVAEGALHAAHTEWSTADTVPPRLPSQQVASVAPGMAPAAVPPVPAPTTGWGSPDLPLGSGWPAAAGPAPAAVHPPAAPSPNRPAGTRRASSVPPPVWAMLAVLTTLLTAASLITWPTRPLVPAGVAGTVMLVRRAATWRPRKGAGFARSRSTASILGTIAAVPAGLVTAAGLTLLVMNGLDSNGDNGLLAAGSIVLGTGLFLTLVAIGLLVVGLRTYPRLVVHADGISYQPDARYRYDLPWTDLARVELAHLAPGRPPALIAVPLPQSPLTDDLARDRRWRPDLDALVIDDLDRLSQRLAADLPHIAQALVHYRAAAGPGPS